MRVVALWFPDWPVQAAKLEAEDTLEEPIAIAVQHRIKVCSQEARRAGVRRGMRVRNAQVVAPELTVVEDNPERDGRTFSALAGSLDDVAASVEVLRPGLVVADLAAAGKFHGDEDTALEMLLDAAARHGIDVMAGAADEIATAVIATRSSHVVAAGESAQFLAVQPLRVLTAETALGADPETVRTLGQLGIQTLGQLAQLPSSAVMTRFGVAGIHLHRISSAAPDRRVAPELPVEDFAVEMTPEEPIERVDAAAFAARALAATLHQRLKGAGVHCLRLKISAELVDATRVERVWRTREALTEAGTADRVRWQLDGWLTNGGAGPIASLMLEPLELAQPDMVGELWSDGASDEGARRVIERVQSQLGMEAVLQPVAVGGRGVAERIQLVPYGEVPPQGRGAFVGAVPSPLPARLGGGIEHPSSRVQLLDSADQPILLNAEVLLSGQPTTLVWGKRCYDITAWAGPWPVDEEWWGAHPTRLARLQVLGHDQAVGTGQRGWLLVWHRQRWSVEALYH